MNNTTEKSANQLYRESGTTLSFAEWIEREKAKGVNIPNIEANAAMMNAIGAEERAKQEETEMNNKRVLIRNIAAVVVVIALGFAVVQTIRAKRND